MYPASHSTPSVQWMLSQAAAKCGVTSRQQLTDNLIHFFTPAKPDFSTPPPPLLSHLHIPLPCHFELNPDTEHSNRTVTLENSGINYSTNHSSYLTYTPSSVLSAQCCENQRNILSDHKDCTKQVVVGLEPPSFEVLSSSPSWINAGPSETWWVGGVQFRMVASPRGQGSVSTARANNIKNNSKNTNTNNKNFNNSGSKKKGSTNTGGRQQEVDSGGKCYPAPFASFEAEVYGEGEAGVDRPAAQQEETDRFAAPTRQDPSTAVDAKEVEKLLQDALWKNDHQKNNDEECRESCSSGGCDTGYSSRCSTPPGPAPLSSEPSTQPLDSKHGTKRHLDVPGRPNDSSVSRESRSQSPSSVSSQGSYRNRQKRRNNSHNNNNNVYRPNNYYPNGVQQQQQQQQQHHYPNHYLRLHNNHQYHHHPHNHFGGGYGGVHRGNNQYYPNHHHYQGLATRESTNFQARRWYGNYGYPTDFDHYRNYSHHGRDFDNFQNVGHLHHVRHNKNFNNRYHMPHTNHKNQSYTQRNGSVRDQKSVVDDPAGVFSDEKVSGNSDWQCEVMETPSDLLDGSEWDGLSQQLWDMFKKEQQTNKTFIKKQKLREIIHRIIRNVIPQCRLYVVGSSLSGFGTDCSDVDMCLVVAHRELDQRTEATLLLRILERELSCSELISVQKMELIRAKVPILKFRDAQSELDVDLNCNNAVGVRNTHLLHSYSQLDWRVRPLVLVVKLWAQYHNINNAKDMTISSYSLVLMVIHYLQKGAEPPVLPCLQKTFPDKFRPNAYISSIKVTEKMPHFTSNNHDSLGKLMHGFLEYFSKKFCYMKETISVRTGGTIPTSECRNARSSKNDSRMWKYLCIEEPFDLTNTARAVYDEAVFDRVRSVFMESYKQLDEKRDLTAILKKV